VFYSISNCQRGLTGVSFGSFLIKQVVEEISRELPRLSTFVTLSPVPGFAAWLARERAAEQSSAVNAEDRLKLGLLDRPNWWEEPETAEALREPVLRAAAAYFLGARTRRGVPVDPVARFHLGNGARLEQIDWLADTSPKGLRQSQGVMVNYLYDLEEIEHNHEAYAENRTIVASNAIKRLARNSTLHLLPVAG
jgi:malonyl-CoA decarboxylase